MEQEKFVQNAKPSFGVKHFIGITSTGKAYSWGKNNFGQLGRVSDNQMSTDKTARPVEFEKSDGSSVHFVRGFVGGSSDSGHSALLDSAGHVWLSGCDRWQQLGLGSSSAGSTGYTWNQGRVWRNNFVRNDFLAEVAGPIRDVALGSDHTIALSVNKKDVYVFGKGGDGQLGLDGKPFVSAPTRSKILSVDCTDNRSKGNVAAVCAIQNCSLVLDDEGEILTKAGRCRKIEKALRICIEQAESDGLVSSLRQRQQPS